MKALTSAAFFFATFVALSSACCTPDQWEGIEVSTGGYAGLRRHGLVQEYVRVAYDATNQRSAAFLDYRKGEYSNKFRIVTRYDNNGGKLYVVDLKRDKCWTKRLWRSFRKACIPDYAKSVGDYYLGLKGGFKVSGYSIHRIFKLFGAYLSVEKLENGRCAPVSETLFGNLGLVGFVQNVKFIDITPGITNASVFNIPEECKNREDFTLAEELTRDHYILAV